MNALDTALALFHTPNLNYHLNDMTVGQLRDLLRLFKQPVGGPKHVLIDQIMIMVRVIEKARVVH